MIEFQIDNLNNLGRWKGATKYCHGYTLHIMPVYDMCSYISRRHGAISSESYASSGIDS